MKDSPSRFPSNNSASIVSEERSKAHTKSLTLMVSSFSVVLVGQSSIDQVKNNHCCGQKKLPKEAQAHCRKTDSGEIASTSVEKPMPVIKNKDISKDHNVRESWILQDSEQFDEQEHLVTMLLQLCSNGKKPDLGLALEIERVVAFSYQKESRRASVCLPQSYNQTKTKRVVYLIRIFWWQEPTFYLWLI